MSEGTHLCWLDKGWFGRLGHVVITFPAFVLQFNVLDRNRVCVGIKIRGAPGIRTTREISVTDRELACFVVDVEDDILGSLSANLAPRPDRNLKLCSQPFFKFGGSCVTPRSSVKRQTRCDRRLSLLLDRLLRDASRLPPLSERLC